MYAVIESGGKQYRIGLGERLRVESLVADPGQTVELDRVLVVADGEDIQVGSPHVPGTTVKARVVGHGRGDKIHVFKMKRRKNYRRSQGHRQNYTELEITAIGDSVWDAPAAPVPAVAEVEAAPEAPQGDDFTRIDGIGPALSSKLVEAGITTFAQIAALGEDDVAKLAAELDFKGRTDWDAWIEQAGQLADEE